MEQSAVLAVVVALIPLPESPFASPALTADGPAAEAWDEIALEAGGWLEAFPLPALVLWSRVVSDSAVALDGALALGGVRSTLRMRNLVWLVLYATR